jgi:hypothetical protein
MKAEMILTVKHTGPHRTLYENCVVEKSLYSRVTLDPHLPEEQHHTVIKSAVYLGSFVCEGMLQHSRA